MFGKRANLLLWIDTEMKGVDLEKFKGRVFLSVGPHLFFSPSSLLACQPFLIFPTNFPIPSSCFPCLLPSFMLILIPSFKLVTTAKQ